MNFKDKRIIVTGAASGFGAAIARHLAAAGARVLVADLNAEGAQAMANSLSQQGGQALACAVDVSKQNDVARMAQTAVDAWGGIDVLVNNAGTTHKNKPALDVTEDEFDRIFRVNVKGLFWATQSVLPIMMRQRSGCVVNVASTTGVRPGPGLTWYSATKAAMINATKGLALEMIERHRCHAPIQQEPCAGSRPDPGSPPGNSRYQGRRGLEVRLLAALRHAPGDEAVDGREPVGIEWRKLIFGQSLFP